MNKKIHSLALLVNLGIYGVALPALANNLASLVKDSSLVSTIALHDLAMQADNLLHGLYAAAPSPSPTPL